MHVASLMGLSLPLLEARAHTSGAGRQWFRCKGGCEDDGCGSSGFHLPDKKTPLGKTGADVVSSGNMTITVVVSQ